MRLLLLSNSVNPDSGYLDHAEEFVRRHFEGLTRILFVPFALHDQEGYTARVRERFNQWGISVEGLVPGPGSVTTLEKASGIFVGGGNTFRLLHLLQQNGLLAPIRRRVLSGLPYMGSSAGTVVAAPTLMTTNDMPIVQPAGFESLGLVPFQINCHYLDADPSSRHMGETRELRINEYLEENKAPVVGLREGALLVVSGPSPEQPEVLLEGTRGARVFRHGGPPVEREPGARLDDLLLPPQR